MLTFRKFKKTLLLALLLFFSHMAQAIPECIFSKLNLAPEQLLSIGGTILNGTFFNYSKNTDAKKPYDTILIDDNCNLVYERKSPDKPIAIFQPDDNGLVYLTRSTGVHGYSIDVYLINHHEGTDKNTVKPALLDLRSEAMMPQLLINDQWARSILVCSNVRHKCDIYDYGYGKEKYTKSKSYRCGKTCNLAKVRAQMLPKISHKSKP